MKSIRYVLRGREFTSEEIALIRELSASLSLRRTISQEVCRRLGWYQPDGKLKERACREVLQKLEAVGEITLPKPFLIQRNRRKPVPRTLFGEPEQAIEKPAGELGPLSLSVVSRTPVEKLWNELIDRYHYLGYGTIVGPCLKLFVSVEGGTRLACVSFAPAAWKIEPRDGRIGWGSNQRVRNLPRVIDNNRFLIFPWVRSKNLASRILSRVEREIPGLWKALTGVWPLLMETFVDRTLFRGTCYQAANWEYVGETKGRAKWNWPGAEYRSTVKQIYLRPLHPKAYEKLRQA